MVARPVHEGIDLPKGPHATAAYNYVHVCLTSTHAAVSHALRESDCEEDRHRDLLLQAIRNMTTSTLATVHPQVLVQDISPGWRGRQALQ